MNKKTVAGSNKKKNACIIVLGDIGRSPRMQYHVKSLLDENYHVDLIGNVETNPIEIICSSNNVKIHDLFKFPDNITIWKPIKYIFKIIWQTLTLISALLCIQKPNFILIQNPPAIPTFIVCYFYCILYRTKFIIDWHNYTYTILALENNKNKNNELFKNQNNRLNFIAKLAKLIESYYGSKADANFCVTEAMKKDLQEKWSIQSTVLYDRPPEKFQSLNLEGKHEIFMKLSKDYSDFLPKDCGVFKERGVIESTSLTQKMIDGTVVYKDNRPAILISSTSWTPDEDFSVLLKALEDYEETAKDDNSYPKVICMITGKGPQKSYYKKKIAKKCWKKVVILTPWLEAEDYPLVIASADLGVCLHWSSSGLDLPMKIVDMFGCGIPVCAINFKCLSELVIDGQNGFKFENSKELATQLKYWFKDFPFNEEISQKQIIFQNNLKKFQSLRWEENWKTNAFPVLEKF